MSVLAREAEGPRVEDQPGLHTEILSQSEHAHRQQASPENSISHISYNKMNKSKNTFFKKLGTRAKKDRKKCSMQG